MKISIITINKNNAAGLEKTCLSIVTQTCHDFEWIIIDGASEDNSVDIIKKYSYKTTYWVSEPDTGVYNAMNKGIKISTGEYLLFLNSGDYLLSPWTLQEVIDEVAISKFADAYFSDVVLNTYEVWQYPKKITLKFLRRRNINSQNCLIRRELFKHRLFDESYQILADWLFFVKEMIEYNISFFHIKTNISMYDSNGISSIISKKLFAETKSIRKELIDAGIMNTFTFSIWEILKKGKYILPLGLYQLLQLFRDYLQNKEVPCKYK
jgi:glycosyltransferase involved in cell wall biosynthesis